MSQPRTIGWMLLCGLVLGTLGCRARTGPVVEALLAGEATHTPIQPFSAAGIELTPEQAYEQQSIYIKEKLRTGRSVAGYKIAYASASQRAVVGTDGPVYGVLTDEMRVPDGGTVVLAGYRRFMAETEVALVIGKTIDRPLATADQLLPYIESVHIAIELPDNPFPFDASPTVPDVIAANVGARRFALGAGRDPKRYTPAGSELSLWIGVQRFTIAEADDALGGPYAATLWLLDELQKRGKTLQAGQVVMTGTPARPFAQPAANADVSGTYAAACDELGRVTIIAR